MTSINPFDPPDPGANRAALDVTGPSADTEQGQRRRGALVPNARVRRGFQDLARGDLEDRRNYGIAPMWEGSRFLDPTPIANNIAYGTLGPGEFYGRTVAPVDPRVRASEMSQSMGTDEQIADRADDAFVEHLKRLMDLKKMSGGS